MKTCTCCNVAQSIENFYTRTCGRLHAQCKKCIYAKTKIRREAKKFEVAKYQAEYYKRNKQHLNAYCKKYREENKERLNSIKESKKDWYREYNREYHAERKDKINARQREYKSANRHLAAQYRQDNKEAIALTQKAWRENNKHLTNAKAARRRAALMQALPSWANLDEIAKIYKTAKEQEGIHVDHIVPLQSDLVCGLHVEHNLQLLPHLENISKGNRYWPDMPNYEVEQDAQ